MSKIKWIDILGWNDEQLEDLRTTGFAYLRQGKYDIAITFFEALSVLDPRSAYDQQTLGALYLQLNNPIRAIKCFEKAMKLEPDHSLTRLNLAKAFFLLDKKEEGLQVANQLKDDPEPQIARVANALLLVYG
jgi:tetratricopeptide (TPR) repeat protein